MQSGGSSKLKEQLLSVERQTGIRPKELDDFVDCPEDLKYIWDWFVELDSTRTGSGFGVNPIQFSEIVAYFTLIDIEPDAFEITALRMLDRVALNHYRKEIDKATKK